MKPLVLFIIVQLFSFYIAFSQNQKDLKSDQDTAYYVTDFKLGGNVAYLLNNHTTNATVFSGGGECGAFGNGTGKGYALGAFVELPLFNLLENNYAKWFDLSIGITYANRNGAFSQALTSGLPILDPNSGKYTYLKQAHSYVAKISYLTPELGIRFTPVPEIPIYLRVLANYSLRFGSSIDYEQTSEILSPSGITYPENNKTVKVLGTGEVLNSKSVFGLYSSIGYDYSIDSNISIGPEIGYYTMLGNVTLDFNWKINSLQFGASGRYSFYRKISPPPPPPSLPIPAPPPPKVAPKPVLAILNTPLVDIKETVVTETFPVLNYIFFDSASTEIPNRYITKRSLMFNEDSLPKRSLETYYQVLNIIGKRLSETKSKITISGASDGKEMSSNKERSEIALSRAKSISNYLINEWGLDPKRITLKSLKTPTYPTNYDYSEGDVENRRVEITSDYEDLLKPIVFERFIERSIEPKEIKFNTSVTSESKIKNWALRMTIKNEIVWEQIGEGNPPSDVVCSLDLIKAKEFADKLLYDTTKNEYKVNDSILCSLTVTNEDSMSNVSISSIPVTRGLSPLELSRLSLIVFDFDRDNVTKSNKKMITGFVSNSISANSDIEIKGSTDKLGEAEHNKELSESRAFAVRDLIKKEKRDAKSIIAKGIGSDELLYDNLIPEGRFYCRTVRVQVSMPLRKQGIK